MLASNVHLLVLVRILEEGAAPSSWRVFGYARLRLGRVGEGGFQVTGEVKESKYITVQDELLGYVTVKFKVSGGCFLSLQGRVLLYFTVGITVGLFYLLKKG